MPIHIIGDSHSLTFQGASNVVVHWLGAITAHNLHNKHQYLAPAFEKASYDDKFWFYFGEIDCRIHLHLKAEELGKTEEGLIQFTVDRYSSVVNEYGKTYSVGIMAITPQGSQENLYEYIRYASREHRQYLTDTFNDYLETACKKYSIPFIDVWKFRGGLWPEEDFQEDKCHIKKEIARKCLEEWCQENLK